jgi:hypothetical protein
MIHRARQKTKRPALTQRGSPNHEGAKLISMRRSSLIIALVASALYAGTPPSPTWKIAKVLDSQATKTRAGIINPTAESIPTITDAQLMILGDEFAYVMQDSRVSGATSLIGQAERAISNRHHGCRFIVGDDVKYWQDKATLHILDADGKECKAEVLRQERLKRPDTSSKN